jgi:hypothetical protein
MPHVGAVREHQLGSGMVTGTTLARSEDVGKFNWTWTADTSNWNWAEYVAYGINLTPRYENIVQVAFSTNYNYGTNVDEFLNNAVSANKNWNSNIQNIPDDSHASVIAPVSTLNQTTFENQNSWPPPVVYTPNPLTWTFADVA